MKLSELIAHVGDENVVFQGLLPSFVSGSVKKHDAEITFATDKTKGQDLITAAATGSETQYVGMIIWLPRARMPGANAAREAPRET